MDTIDMGYSLGARKFALLVAIVAGATLGLRVYLRLELSDGVVGAVSYLSQFFTILTNLLIFIFMALIAIGRSIPKRLMRALAIAIICVGLVYHAVLAHLLDLSGLDLLADHGVHTVVPLLTLVWWLFLASKPKFSWTDVPHWVVWPLIYCGYILVRASDSGFYPYPFLNVSELGYAGVAINVIALVVVFIAVGFVLMLLERFARTNPTPSDLA